MPNTETELFRAAITHSWNAIVITDADPAGGYRVQFANAAFCTMTGYSLDELRGNSLKMLQGPQTDQTVIQRLRNCLKDARYFEGSTVNYRKDGSSYTVRWNISPVRNDAGRLTHFVSIQQDISTYVEAEERNRLLLRALDASGDPILVTDANSRIVFANGAFGEVTGYAVDELRGKTPALLRSGEHDAAFYEELRRVLSEGREFRATFVNRRRDGSLYHAEQTISPIFDLQGRITHYVSVSKDITERVVLEQALRQAATQDTLTGLLNRRHGEHLLNEAFRNDQQCRPLTIMLCDIDHFKQINDRFGHLAGDRVLRRVAEVLRAAVRGDDAVIRWGGDEFMLLLDKCADARAISLAERNRAQVEANEDAEAGRITLSLGLATLAPGEALEQLIDRADAALYSAKCSGRNRVAIAAGLGQAPS